MKATFGSAISLTILLTACSAHRYASVPYQRLDPNTDYAVEDQPDGFTIYVYYSCYQFFPAYGTASEAGKSTLRSLAYDEAAKRGRELEPPNTDAIMWNTGRDALGNTSWSGKLHCRFTPAADQTPSHSR